MCNYFGSGCNDQGGFPLFIDPLQQQNSLLSNIRWTDSPQAHLAAQMPETPNQKLARQRANWLTQEEIDKMEIPRPESRFRRILNWLNGEPGGAFTLFVLVMFCLGLWAAVALWRMR